MQAEGDHLVIEVGASTEVPTVEFRVEGGVLFARIGEEEHPENHAAGRGPLVDRAILLLRTAAGVRVLPDAPAIEITTRVAHGARSRRQAAVEVGILNRSNAWVWWQVVGHDIFQTATVESMPFAPYYLMTTMAVFLKAMQLRDDLALRVGGEVA